MSTRGFQSGVIFSIALAVAGLMAVASDARAWGDHDDDDSEEIPFAEAEIFFELNNTDGDLGIHSSIDGDAWKRLEIEDPNGRRMLLIRVRGRLMRQGLTQLFFESAEPTFDELPPDVFFRRFPEGTYEIEGVTLDGEELESETELTHVLAAPPSNIRVNGEPASEDCDEDPGPLVSDPVVISWDPVVRSHPTLGITDVPVEVELYQVVVEQEDVSASVSIEVPPSVTEVEVPSALIDFAGEFKLEILVREASGNQTATETCFEVEADD